MKDEYAERRAARSICVGNIPLDMHEDKMKEIFSSVGPVSSFRIIYDHDTQKSRGYGYCEYSDKETAITASMNFSGYELGGRTLKVDSANNEKCIKEIQALIDEEAPETISKAVASLPPDQMFELMRQIKQCIENNAEEARTMLINNPPLTYALLEAQLVMGIVDLQETWALIEASPVQKQEATETPQVTSAPALKTSAVATLAESRETAENLNSEARNSATGTNRHPLIDAFTADQSSRDSRTMDSSATEQHPRIQDSHILDYNSDSRSIDDDALMETHSLIGGPQDVDMRSGDSRPADQNSRPGNSLIAEQLGTDSHSRDSFPVTSHSQGIEPQQLNSRLGAAHSVDPRVADRRSLDPRITADPQIPDPRIADRLPVAMEPSQDSRSGEPRSMDPRALYSHSAVSRVDPRMGEKRMDPRMGDWRFKDSHVSDPNSIDSDSAKSHFDSHLMDPRAVQSHPPEPRSLNTRPLAPRGMDPRAASSRPTDPYFADPRNPRSRDAHEVASATVEPRSQDPRMGHMGPDFRAADSSRGYGGDLHTRDPRLSRSVPHPTQPPHHVKDRPAIAASGFPRPATNPPAIAASGFPRSAVNPHTSTTGTAPSHSEPGKTGITPATSDEEKAALIMQVLQLSDEQIAALSAEQQQSILVLKEQIAKSSLQ